MKTALGTHYAELRRIALSFPSPVTVAQAEETERLARSARLTMTSLLICRAMWSAARANANAARQAQERAA